jgi:hypothetical protein
VWRFRNNGLKKSRKWEPAVVRHIECQIMAQFAASSAGDDGWLSKQGRAVKQRVEALTDDLAAKPYESLEPDALDELVVTLEPLATLLLAAQDS